MRAKWGLGVGAAGAAMALALGSCLDATQVTVHVTTDLACDEARRGGLTLYGGDVGGATHAIAGTSDCTEAGSTRSYGTLVIAPSGDQRGASFGLTVVAGVTRPADECAANGYAGCIVARRRVSFAAHRRLDLPVLLSRSCLDVVCPDDQTCVPCTDSASCATPRCAPAGAPNACDSPDSPECTRGVRMADGGVVVDGGVPVDGGPTDAAIDAPIDAGGEALVRVVTSPAPVWGLAATATHLFWTSADPGTGNIGVVFRAPLVSPGTTAEQVFPKVEKLRGLDVARLSDGGDFLAAAVAGPSASVGAFLTDLGNTLPLAKSNAFGIAFVAFNPGTNPFVSSVLLGPGDGGPAAVVSSVAPPGAFLTLGATGYARGSTSGRILFASGPIIGEYVPDGGTRDGGAGPPGRTLHAVASVGAGRRYVTVDSIDRGPTLFVSSDVDGTWRPFGFLPGGEQGVVSGAEDILITTVNSTRRLFVAASDGIWSTDLP